MSLNISSRDLNRCSEFIGSLSIILENRREYHLLTCESDALAGIIDVHTTELEEMDKMEIRDGFLTRRYIDNIFKYKVEECMVEIDRMRNTIKRHEKKKELTGKSHDKIWDKSNLFTAQGSIFALAYLLLRKMED